MAARRLLILMLVLLGISSVIAVIIPNPRREAREQESREQDAKEPTGQDGGKQGGRTGPGAGSAGVTAGEPGNGGKKAAEPDQVTTGAPGSPQQVTLSPGGKVRQLRGIEAGRLILTVEAEEPSQVTIPDLGRDGFADRWAPAVFDLMLPASRRKISIYTVPPDGRNRVRRAVIITSP